MQSIVQIGVASLKEAMSEGKVGVRIGLANPKPYLLGLPFQGTKILQGDFPLALGRLWLQTAGLGDPELGQSSGRAMKQEFYFFINYIFILPFHGHLGRLKAAHIIQYKIQ